MTELGSDLRYPRLGRAHTRVRPRSDVARLGDADAIVARAGPSCSSREYSSLQTGLAWMSGSVPSIVFAGVSQRLVTRRGPKVALALGVCLIATAVIWGTQTPVHGPFRTNLVGPFTLAGIGTAFSFIPISIAAHIDLTTTERR